MALIEAVLTYYPKGIGDQSGQVIIGRTEDDNILRILSDHIISQAKEEVKMWSSIDPGVAAMCQADVQKLISILSFLVPDEELQPELKSIKGGKNEDESKVPLDRNE
ncbi:hypothetical protein [Cytobacillus firmus]|uniref:hypothetical protein n=1 Tax=Cytobacillus firmus TaxID=1399 RepID=UPI002163457A|nr:hypothetical protein [Cytobacillus firmus]MCS0674624.1 hypothetical protein [Cytobacillus firmus]